MSTGYLADLPSFFSKAERKAGGRRRQQSIDSMLFFVAGKLNFRSQSNY